MVLSSSIWNATTTLDCRPAWPRLPAGPATSCRDRPDTHCPGVAPPRLGRRSPVFSGVSRNSPMQRHTRIGPPRNRRRCIRPMAGLPSSCQAMRGLPPLGRGYSRSPAGFAILESGRVWPACRAPTRDCKRRQNVRVLPERQAPQRASKTIGRSPAS